MADPEPSDSGPPVTPTPALPVVEYASHTTPRRARILSQVPAEVVAIGLALVSTLLGSTANDMERGAGLLFVPAVVAGVAWYVILRARRRKRTRLLWNVQLVLATLACIAGTMGMVFAVKGFPLLEWRNYGRARAWADLYSSGSPGSSSSNSRPGWTAGSPATASDKRKGDFFNPLMID